MHLLRHPQEKIIKDKAKFLLAHPRALERQQARGSLNHQAAQEPPWQKFNQGADQNVLFQGAVLQQP